MKARPRYMMNITRYMATAPNLSKPSCCMIDVRKKGIAISTKKMIENMDASIGNTMISLSCPMTLKDCLVMSQLLENVSAIPMNITQKKKQEALFILFVKNYAHKGVLSHH